MIPASVYESTLRGFLAPIGSLLNDPSVTEILVNGPGEVFVERRGQLSRSVRTSQTALGLAETSISVAATTGAFLLTFTG